MNGSDRNLDVHVELTWCQYSLNWSDGRLDRQLL